MNEVTGVWGGGWWWKFVLSLPTSQYLPSLDQQQKTGAIAINRQMQKTHQEIKSTGAPLRSTILTSPLPLLSNGGWRGLLLLPFLVGIPSSSSLKSLRSIRVRSDGAHSERWYSPGRYGEWGVKTPGVYLLAITGGMCELDSNEGGRRGSGGERCLVGEREVGVGSTLFTVFRGLGLRCWYRRTGNCCCLRDEERECAEMTGVDCIEDNGTRTAEEDSL